ncbi:MAG: copper resistance protein NlpE [Methylovulum sp.]|nr:copper resistance protein NlpE [Methylovulum sp.]
MQVSKQRNLTVFLFIALFLGNAPAFAEETTDPHAAHHAQTTIDWPGVYYGFTPCADCKGVKTSLALNNNGSYILMTQNVGKSEREFVEKGKFTWHDENDTIVLTPRNSQLTRHYAVGTNTLTQLDDSGNRIAGKNADGYILRRNELTQPQSQAHAAH